MRVKEIMYVAEGDAARAGDYVRLKLTLVRDGVDQDWNTMEGESKYMNRWVWSVAHAFRAGAGVEADELRVEAFDVEVETQYLVVNGHRYRIPRTGVLNTRTYKFPLAS